MNSDLPVFLLRSLVSRTWVCVLGLLAAAMVAIMTSIELTHPSTIAPLFRRFGAVGPNYVQSICAEVFVHHGANINRATELVASSCIAAAVAIGVVRKWRRLLTAVLLLEAVAFCVAIGLVAADSASYNAYSDCGTYALDLGWLYAALGVPLALLLGRAFGAWKRIEPPKRRLPPLPRGWETGA